MPSTYAHYRFGAKVLERLPEDVRGVILPYRALYDIGLQGPDILFHYKVFSPNEISRLGHRMHEWSGKKFFGPLEKKAHSDAAKAYLWGLLCHFTLDSVCHGTVNEASASTGIHHFDVETEYERALMLRDGLDPFKHKPAAHYAPNDTLGEVMADFFGITKDEALSAVRSMKTNIGLLVARNPVWSLIVGTVLKMAKADSFYALMVKKQVKEELTGCTARLMELGVQAEDVALRLIDRQIKGDMMDDAQMKLDFSNGAVKEDA